MMRIDHPIHGAAEAGDVDAIRRWLDGEPALLDVRDRKGATPLHRAVAAGARRTVTLLLDRGADVHARHLDGPGDAAGYAPVDFEPIDVALFEHDRADFGMAQLLVERGAAYDLTVAAACGDLVHVSAALDAAPARIHEARPHGRRPLSAAVAFGHDAIVRLLLDRGADPTWAEGAKGPRGAALHAAATRGDLTLVDLLLDHGADPNAHVDAAGSPTFAARTPEVRARLLARGGILDCYDLVWLNEDDEVVRRVSADPAAADSGCGGVFTAAATLGKRDLVARLIAAGARVPAVVTGCRSYLLEDPGILRLLLESGAMDPDGRNAEGATALHDLCGRDGRGRPRAHRVECAALLLDAGASIDARDRETGATPLGWAARHDLPDMAAYLRARGATA
jgi:ankyrin repeat protein